MSQSEFSTAIDYLRIKYSYHLHETRESIKDELLPVTKAFGSKAIVNYDVNTLCDFDFNIFHPEVMFSKDQLLSTASKVGVTWFVSPGSYIEESRLLLKLVEDVAYKNIIVTAGVHPYNVMKNELDTVSLDQLSLLIALPSCKAVGECGLDYSKGFPDKVIQIPWFRAQIGLALKFSKPLYLHSRDSQDDFLNVMSEFGIGPSLTVPVPCCVHCFTGDTNELKVYLSCGFYIGLTGYVFGIDKERLAEWLSLITLDRLVIETDAPYMGFKGCRKAETSMRDRKYPNVPSSLVLLLNLICEVSGWSHTEVARKTTENALVKILGLNNDYKLSATLP